MAVSCTIERHEGTHSCWRERFFWTALAVFATGGGASAQEVFALKNTGSEYNLIKFNLFNLSTTTIATLPLGVTQGSSFFDPSTRIYGYNAIGITRLINVDTGAITTLPVIGDDPQVNSTAYSFSGAALQQAVQTELGPVLIAIDANRQRADRLSNRSTALSAALQSTPPLPGRSSRIGIEFGEAGGEQAVGVNFSTRRGPMDFSASGAFAEGSSAFRAGAGFSW